MAKPYEAVHLDEVDSTQDEARTRFGAGDGGPVLVAASRQRAGRGRSGHGWLNAPRAVAASLAFAPSWPQGDWTRLPLVAGLAARDAAGPLGLKWPNDLWRGPAVGGVKVGGILSEAAGRVVVVGMGLNLWWADAPRGVGALAEEDPGAAATAQVAGRWADALLVRVAAGPGAWGHDEYRDACVTLGHLVEWEVPPGPRPGRGAAVDVDEDGSLVVEAAGTRLTLRSAGVRTIRATTLPPGAGREPR
jgi:BirA family transcriptional regulator, biotin operon repressor / biotin---[acetyl-CoA-carboxylase] ligase